MAQYEGIAQGTDCSLLAVDSTRCDFVYHQHDERGQEIVGPWHGTFNGNDNSARGASDDFASALVRIGPHRVLQVQATTPVQSGDAQALDWLLYEVDLDRRPPVPPRSEGWTRLIDLAGPGEAPSIDRPLTALLDGDRGLVVVGSSKHSGVTPAQRVHVRRFTQQGVPIEGGAHDLTRDLVIDGLDTGVHAAALDAEGRLVLGGDVRIGSEVRRAWLRRFDGAGRADETFAPIAPRPERRTWISSVAITPDGAVHAVLNDEPLRASGGPPPRDVLLVRVPPAGPPTMRTLLAAVPGGEVRLHADERGLWFAQWQNAALQTRRPVLVWHENRAGARDSDELVVVEFGYHASVDLFEVASDLEAGRRLYIGGQAIAVHDDPPTSLWAAVIQL